MRGIDKRKAAGDRQVVWKLLIKRVLNGMFRIYRLRGTNADDIWIIYSLIKKVYRGPNNTSLPGRSSSKSFAVFSRANELQEGVRRVYSGLIEPA